MSMESVTLSDSREMMISPTPKLSIFSLPHYTPPETVTPPFQTPASVPFKWEEVPGKPFAGGEAPAKPKAARCLHLPPGKITNSPSAEGEITNTPSPSSVLDGSSLSFRKLLKREGKITDRSSPGSASFSFRRLFLKGDGKMPLAELGLDGSGPEKGGSVWKFDHKVNMGWGFQEEEGTFDFLSPLGGVEEEIPTTFRKRTSFWANIYKNVKQAVPWKRRQDKRRKMNM